MVSKLIASLVGVAVMASSAVAEDYPDDDWVPGEQVVVMRNTCQHAAEQAVKLTGGELLSARPAKNGKPICSVVVLVINAKGRPRKVRMAIPMNF